MMKIQLPFRMAFVLTILVLLGTLEVMGATRYSVANGNWNSTATWSATSGGGSGVSFPVAGDIVFLEAGRQVTVTAGASCASVSFTGNGTTLTVNSTVTLTVSGAVTVISSNNTSYSSIVAGAGTLNCASLAVGTSVNPSAKVTTTLTSSIASLTISGNLSLYSSDKGNKQNDATFYLPSGTVSVNGTASTNEDTRQNSSTFTMATGSQNATLFLGGTTPFNLGGGTNFIILSGTSTTVNYNFSGAQTIYPVAYQNLTLSGSGVKTLQAGTTSIGGNFTLSGTTSTTTVGSLAIAGNLNVGSGTSITVPGFNFTVAGTTSITGTLTNNSIAGIKTFTGDVTINTGGLLSNTANVTISFGANLINNGTFSAGTSTITFAGLAAQTLGGSNSVNVTNLNLNNANGLTLGGTNDLTITGTLTFTAGKINTGTRSVILGNSALVTGAGAGNYINGNLRKGIAASTVSKTFEIGDGSYYTPVTINFAGSTNAAGFLTARTTTGNHPNLNTSTINPVIDVNRYWTLTNSGVTGFSSFDATFSFNSADVIGGADYNSFIMGNYFSSAWNYPTVGTLSSTSFQAIGLTTFGDFQVGESSVPPVACLYGDNGSTPAISDVMPCIDFPSNPQTISTTLAARQYFTMNVIKGLTYQVYTCNPISPASPLTMVVYKEGSPSDPYLAFSFSNAGNPCTAVARNVYVSFTPTFSGQVRVLINRKSFCSSLTPLGLTVNVDVTGGSNLQDSEAAAGTDTWIGHIYDGLTYNNYLGYYNTGTETFQEAFGTGGTWPDHITDDVTCFNFYSSGAVRASIKDVTFSVRYRMNSTKRGFYSADFTGDDGTRLSVDGNMVYSDWIDHAPITNSNILFSLSGNSSLAFEYYENGGQNVAGITNLVQIFSNTLSSNTSQSICLGNNGATISGDVYGVLSTGITLSGTGYQWVYSTTPTGVRTTIAGATAETFTPSATVAPFNVPGTYYVFRNAVLSSVNNVTPNPYIATNESNVATLTVNSDSYWTGVLDGDWNNPGNWACNQLPTIATNVVIANGKPNYPTLLSGNTGKTNNLTIESSSSVIVSGNTLQIAGVISNSGFFNATNGTIEMKGVAAQTIGSNVFAGNTIMNLILNNPAGTSLQGQLNVTGIVLATNGDLASGGNLTLVSTAAQTALIDGSGTGNITGNVTMQRYLPSAFGYKYMSSPFQSATVNEFADDLDLTATFPTFYYYDEDNHRDSSNVAVSKSGWVKYINSTSFLAPLRGYAANFGSVSVVKTVDMTGFVNNGLLQMNFMNHNWKYTKGFNLIGNPYPSPIDWKAGNGWTKMNIDDAIWFFNAGSDQYTGYYTSYVNGVSSGNANNIIASMQGFFVHVTDGAYPVNATLGLNNSVRINDLNPAFKRAHIENRSILRFSASFETKNAIEDATVIYFDDLATGSFDYDMDALKLMNTDLLVPNIYTLSPDIKELSINGMPFLTDSITKIPLGITTFSDGYMNFNAKDISQLPTELNIYLYDAEKSIMQNLDESPEYRFFLKAGEHNQRFSLIFSYSVIVEPTNSTEKMFAFSRSSDFLAIKMNLPFNSKGNLMVTNMLGQILLRKEVSEKETVEVKLNVSTGVYIVTLISGNRKESQKILMRKDYE